MKILLTCGLLGAALLTCLARSDYEVVVADRHTPIEQVCILPDELVWDVPVATPIELAAGASFNPPLAGYLSREVAGTTRPWVFNSTHWWPG